MGPSQSFPVASSGHGRAEGRKTDIADGRLAGSAAAAATSSSTAAFTAKSWFKQFPIARLHLRLTKR